MNTREPVTLANDTRAQLEKALQRQAATEVGLEQAQKELNEAQSALEGWKKNYSTKILDLPAPQEIEGMEREGEQIRHRLQVLSDRVEAYSEAIAPGGVFQEKALERLRFEMKDTLRRAWVFIGKAEMEQVKGKLPSSVLASIRRAAVASAMAGVGFPEVLQDLFGDDRSLQEHAHLHTEIAKDHGLRLA